MVIKLTIHHRVAQVWLKSPLRINVSEKDDPNPVMQTLAPGPYKAFWQERFYDNSNISGGFYLALDFSEDPEATAWMLTWL